MKIVNVNDTLYEVLAEHSGDRDDASIIMKRLSNFYSDIFMLAPTKHKNQPDVWLICRKIDEAELEDVKSDI